MRTGLVAVAVWACVGVGAGCFDSYQGGEVDWAALDFDDDGVVNGVDELPLVDVDVDAVAIPAGAFWMGCNASLDGACDDDESPQHRVDVPAFDILRTEVSASVWAECELAGSCSYGCSDGSEHPIACVDWNDASAFCAWLGWRLCTEAEWEYAARGGCVENGCAVDDDACCQAAMRTYPWGESEPTCDTTQEYGCPGDTLPVGSLPAGASPFGVLDMAGNLWEWVQDCYHSSYTDAPANGKGWTADCSSYRVRRGGSFGNVAAFVRAAYRFFDFAAYGNDFLGLRCCRSTGN